MKTAINLQCITKIEDQDDQGMKYYIEQWFQYVTKPSDGFLLQQFLVLN